MRVFISYASHQRVLAEHTCRVLESEGHDVFFDRDRLRAGDVYGERIRTAVLRSHVFVFLVDRKSIASPSYALAELAVVGGLRARERPRVVPVLVEAVDLDQLPTLLKPVTLLEPKGKVAVEIAGAVAGIGRQRRARLLRLATAAAVIAAVVAVSAWSLRPQPVAPSSQSPDVMDAMRELNQRNITRRQPAISGSLSNSGWTVHFQLPDLAPREIFYKLDNEPTFHRTPLLPHRNMLTGLPYPDTAFELTGPIGVSHDIEMKYIDNQGHEQGPFRFRFDPKLEHAKEIRSLLERTSVWVEFYDHADEGLRVSFGSIMAWKNAFQQIRYSVDSDALSERVTFVTDWSQRGLPGSDERDKDVINIPRSTRYVSVQLLYIDGTTSELKRFVLSEVGVDRR